MTIHINKLTIPASPIITLTDSEFHKVVLAVAKELSWMRAAPLWLHTFPLHEWQCVYSKLLAIEEQQDASITHDFNLQTLSVNQLTQLVREHVPCYYTVTDFARDMRNREMCRQCVTFRSNVPVVHCFSAVNNEPNGLYHLECLPELWLEEATCIGVF